MLTFLILYDAFCRENVHDLIGKCPLQGITLARVARYASDEK